MKLQENAPGQQIPVIDNPDIGEVFIDHMAGILFNGSTFNLTLTAMRNDHTRDPAPQHRQVVCRLAMPAGSAREIADQLKQFIAQLEERGLFPQPTAPTTIQ